MTTLQQLQNAGIATETINKLQFDNELNQIIPDYNLSLEEMQAIGSKMGYNVADEEDFTNEVLPQIVA